MYRAIAFCAAASLGMLVLVLACDDDGPKINSTCEDFCGAMVDAMENSMDSSESDSQIYVDSPKEARKECELSCTQTIDELKDSDSSAVEDCLDCVAEAASSSDDFYEFLANVSLECDDECADDDPGDDDPWDDLFWDDFMQDFDEHVSTGDPDVDVDMDIDGDADMDGDGDGDSDADCPSNVVNDCGSAYLDCYNECAGDTECGAICYDDYCWCLENGGCDSAEYGC